MTDDPEPRGGGAELDGMHVATLTQTAADYRPAYRLLRGGLWRSPAIRGHILRHHFLYLFACTLAGAGLFFGYHMVAGRAAALNFPEKLGWAGGLLPIAIGIALGFAMLITALICLWSAWQLRRFRQEQEGDIGTKPVFTIAWDEARFGIVVEDQLFAMPIADLSAWQETDDHLFIIAIGDREALIPISKAQTDPAALAVLRTALLRTDLPALWPYAEKIMLARLEKPAASA